MTSRLVGASLLAAAVALAACRKASPPRPSPRQDGAERGADDGATAASASASAAPSASASASASVLDGLDTLRGAARWGEGRVVVGGARREERPFALLFKGDQLVEGVALKDAEPPADSAADGSFAVDVVSSAEGLAVWKAGRGGWRLWRATSWEGLREADAEPGWGPACAAGGKILRSEVRQDGTAALALLDFSGGPSREIHKFNRRAPLSLICGTRRAYLHLDEREQVIAIDGEKLSAPAPFDQGAPRGEEYKVSFHASGDALLAVRLADKGQVAVRRWEPSAAAPGPWEVMGEKLDEGSTIEQVMADGARLGLVVSHTTEASGCKNGETTNTLADLVIFDVATRKLARPRVHLERWTCGDDAGSFGGGALKGSFAVLWPRAPDAACLKQGVRHGGLGYALIPASGAPKTGRVEAPAGDWFDLGCEGEECAALVLPRGGDGGCWPASDPRSARPRWVKIP